MSEEVDLFDINFGPERCIECLELILRIIDDARLLVAGQYLEKLDQLFVKFPDHPGVLEARHRIDGVHAQAVALLRARVVEIRATMKDFDSNEDWKFGQVFMGITTMYRYGFDGTIWVKLEGLVEGVSILDEASVVREGDLYRLWAPFCDHSLVLREMGYIELVLYMHISAPLLPRDAVVHAYGCDAAEEGCVVVIGKSVETFEGCEIPAVTGYGCKRMDIRSFKCKLSPLSRTSASTCVIVNVDPKAPLPQSLVNFFIKKVAGMIIWLLQRTAKQVASDPTCAHAVRMREKHDLYFVWLQRKLERYLALQQSKQLVESNDTRPEVGAEQAPIPSASDAAATCGNGNLAAVCRNDNSSAEGVGTNSVVAVNASKSGPAAAQPPLPACRSQVRRFYELILARRQRRLQRRLLRSNSSQGDGNVCLQQATVEDEDTDSDGFGDAGHRRGSDLARHKKLDQRLMLLSTGIRPTVVGALFLFIVAAVLDAAVTPSSVGLAMTALFCSILGYRALTL